MCSGYAPASMRAFVGRPRHCIIKAGFDGTDEDRRFPLDETDTRRGGGGDRRSFDWGKTDACAARDCRETRRCAWGERAHVAGTVSDGALSGVRRSHEAGGTVSDGAPVASSSESEIVMVAEAAGCAAGAVGGVTSVVRGGFRERTTCTNNMSEQHGRTTWSQNGGRTTW